MKYYLGQQDLQGEVCARRFEMCLKIGQDDDVLTGARFGHFASGRLLWFFGPSGDDVGLACLYLPVHPSSFWAPSLMLRTKRP